MGGGGTGAERGSGNTLGDKGLKWAGLGSGVSGLKTGVWLVLWGGILPTEGAVWSKDSKAR